MRHGCVLYDPVETTFVYIIIVVVVVAAAAAVVVVAAAAAAAAVVVVVVVVIIIIIIVVFVVVTISIFVFSVNYQCCHYHCYRRHSPNCYVVVIIIVIRSPCFNADVQSSEINLPLFPGLGWERF